MVLDAAAPGRASLPDGRPGELSPGLAGRRDRLRAPRDRGHRRTATRQTRGGGMKRAGVLLAAGIAAALSGGAAGAGNSYDYCLLCHGSNANGNYGIRAPKISGVEPWYLARQLENFAAGARGLPGDDASGHEMMPVGQRLKTAGEIEAAVEFVGGLDSKKPAP